MDNNEQHDIDKCFQDHFGDAEVPKFNFGEEQETTKADDAMDSLFQGKFDEFEEVPHEKIWNNIQKDLPLHLLWRRRLTQMSKVAAIFLIGLFLSLIVAEKSDYIKGLVYQNETEVRQEVPTPVIEPSDFVFDANTESNDLEEESSKTLFQDDVVSKDKEEDINKALLEPVSPLPKLSLQEVTATNGMNQDENDSSNTVAIPLRVTGSDKSQGIDKYDADIMARTNQVNPAQ